MQVMPKVTIEIDFMGDPDMVIQRPVAKILRDHSRYLLCDYAKNPKPEGQIQYDFYKATLKWKVSRDNGSST